MEIPLILNISHYSILLPFVVGLVSFIRLSNSLKILFYLICIGALVEYSSTLLSMSNHLMMNLFDIVEFLLFMIIIYKFNDIPRTKKYILAILSIYLIFRISLLALGIEKITDFKSHAQVITHISLIGFSITNLIIISKKADQYLLKLPKFWILFAIALYFSATFFLTLSNLILGDIVLIELYEIHGYSNVLCNTLFAYSFILDFVSKNKLIPSSNVN